MYTVKMILDGRIWWYAGVETWSPFETCSHDFGTEEEAKECIERSKGTFPEATFEWECVKRG